jgi:hypothetical protein
MAGESSGWEKGGKMQNGSGQNQLQKTMFKPFPVASISNWHIDMGLYV